MKIARQLLRIAIGGAVLTWIFLVAYLIAGVVREWR